MKITLEPTTKVVELKDPASGAYVPARIWEGQTEDGTPCHAYIVRIGVPEELEPARYRQFETALQECRKPSPQVQMFSPRMVL